MGFANAELTITGTGFSGEVCENTVTVGGTDCAVTAASATELSCSLDTTAVTSLSGLTVAVTTANHGQAVLRLPEDSAAKLHVVPKIESISPATGSWAGGKNSSYLSCFAND